MSFWNGKRILLTGGDGFLGQAIHRALVLRGVEESDITVPHHCEQDLRDRRVVQAVVAGHEIVIHCAAQVGGIGFNKKNPASIFFDNTLMGLFLLEESHKAGVKKFVGVGSIVEHPEFAEIPYREEALWNGYPDRVNSAYALAKRCMLAQSQFCRDQHGLNAIHLLPVKIYGPGMCFDPDKAQVIASLLMKIDGAQRSGQGHIELWGTGRATREFLYIEDAADAVLLATELYDGREPVNVGSGQEVSIRQVAETLCRLMGFGGELRWDASQLEGQLRSVADVAKAKEAFGFVAATSLEEGLRRTLAWYRQSRPARSCQEEAINQR